MNRKEQNEESEVMGAAEAAACLGVRQPNLRKVKGLPEPMVRLKSGSLWRAKEIRALAAQRAATKTKEA